MIEVEGVAIPLEPGQKYLIAVRRGQMGEATRARFLDALRTRGIDAVLVPVNDPATDIRVIKVEEAERG